MNHEMHSRLRAVGAALCTHDGRLNATAADNLRRLLEEIVKEIDALTAPKPR